MFNKQPILIILILLISFSSSGELYRVFVDKEFGFFAVRSDERVNLTYDDHTLYINKNDTIQWENSGILNERIWIISDNKLWNKSDALIGVNYKIFTHTFNKIGTYKVHIDGSNSYSFNNTSINASSTVVYGEINYDENGDYESGGDVLYTTKPSESKINIETTWYPTKYQTIMVGIPQKENGGIISTLLNIKNATISKITRIPKEQATQPLTNYVPSKSNDASDLTDYENYTQPIPITQPNSFALKPLFPQQYQKLTIFEILKKLLNK